MPFPSQTTQFQPGNPGGPGRPRFNSISAAAKRILAKPHPKNPDKTRAEVIAERWVARAEDDIKDLNPLLDRTEGKVAPVEIEADIDLKAVAREMQRIDGAEPAAPILCDEAEEVRG